MKFTDVNIANNFTAKAAKAKERGIEFTLSFPEFKRLLNTKHCAYTGVVLTVPDGAKQIATTRTIDRIDATKGYVSGNCVACCYEANQVKNAFEKKKIVTCEHILKMLEIMGVCDVE